MFGCPLRKIILILLLILESEPKTVTNEKPIERNCLPNYEENDTTDLTEIDENTTKQEAFKKFQSTRNLYQSQDIAGTLIF